MEVRRLDGMLCSLGSAFAVLVPPLMLLFITHVSNAESRSGYSKDLIKSINQFLPAVLEEHLIIARRFNAGSGTKSLEFRRND